MLRLGPSMTIFYFLFGMQDVSVDYVTTWKKCHLMKRPYLIRFDKIKLPTKEQYAKGERIPYVIIAAAAATGVLLGVKLTL